MVLPFLPIVQQNATTLAASGQLHRDTAKSQILALTRLEVQGRR
jgi:hypothetical protein